jgi:hypothetical protein
MKVNGLTNDEVKSHLQVSNPTSPLTFIHPLHIHPSISAPGDEDSLPLFVVTWICNMSDDAVGQKYRCTTGGGQNSLLIFYS